MTVDPHISDLVAGETIPDHLPGFWDRFDAELATPTATAPTVTASASDDFGADVLVMPPLEVLDEEHSDGVEPERRWSFFLVAAALLLIVGAVGALFASRATQEATIFATEAGTADPLGAVRDSASSGDDTPLFSVTTSPETDSGGYWRLMTLERFNGSVWTRDGSYGAGIDVPGTPPPEFPVGETTSRTVTLLSEMYWLPYESRLLAAATSDDSAMKWSDENGLRVTELGQTVKPPLEYTFHVAPLAAASSSQLNDRVTPDGVVELTKLPTNFPPEVRELAAQLTKDSETAYEKALTLQQFFRTEFIYDFDPPRYSDSDDMMVEFLDSRVGYAEQFAGTYAAMMRSLGVPARIVVGFTPGDPDPNDSSRLIVSGKHGHAWVEVFVDFEGEQQWLEFEPSPGRGAPDSGPVAEVDHWHSVYAVYDCNTGGYLPPFRSARDEYGIHSHGDGVIHIHPFTDDAAGVNARLDLFLETMGIEVDASGIRAPEERIDATVPETCLGGEPVLHLRKWANADAIGFVEPEIITGNIGRTRFLNDREVYVLAIAPLDAELPPLPDERLATFDAVAVPAG